MILKTKLISLRGITSNPPLCLTDTPFNPPAAPHAASTVYCPISVHNSHQTDNYWWLRCPFPCHWVYSIGPTRIFINSWYRPSYPCQWTECQKSNSCPGLSKQEPFLLASIHSGDWQSCYRALWVILLPSCVGQPAKLNSLTTVMVNSGRVEWNMAHSVKAQIVQKNLLSAISWIMEWTGNKKKNK